MKLAPDLYSIDGIAGAHAYLVKSEVAMVIDTGMPRQESKILGFLAATGVGARALRVILLTHHDIDHMGSAAALQRATGAEIWAPLGDAPYILGNLPRHGLKRVLPGLMRPFFGRLRPCLVDRTLSEDDMVPGGFRVVATPGHTPGHVSLYRPGVLIAGDLVFSAGTSGPLRSSPRVMNWNTSAVQASIRKVSDLPCTMVLPGHGPIVRRDGQRLLQALVDRQ